MPIEPKVAGFQSRTGPDLSLLTRRGFLGGAIALSTSWSGCAGQPVEFSPNYPRRDSFSERPQDRRTVVGVREPTPEELGEYVAGLYPGDTFFKKVAFTFDDGPVPRFTARVLDVLKEQRCRATFFVSGRRTLVYPDLIRRIVDEGHQLGNHTWSHADLSFSNPQQIRDEINRSQDAVNRVLGCHYPLKLFRPPFGAPWFVDRRSRPRLCGRVGQIVQERGMLNILWQLGSGDTLGNCTPSQIVRRCRGYFQRGAGGVLVFHDTKWWTAAALPTVIKNARYDGFQEVMPADLLEEKYNTSLSRLISLPTALPPLRTARRG